MKRNRIVIKVKESKIITKAICKKTQKFDSAGMLKRESFRKKHNYAFGHLTKTGVNFIKHERGVSTTTPCKFGDVIHHMNVGTTSPQAATLHAADYVLHKFTLGNFEIYKNFQKRRDHDHIRVLLDSIKAQNIHDSDIYGLRCNAGSLISEDHARPEYLDAFIRSMNDPDIIKQMDEAFISGSGITGFYNAYRKFAQTGEKLSVDWDIFLTAYYRMRSIFDIKPYKTLPLDEDVYDRLEIPRWKIGGVFGGSVYNMEGEGKITTASTVTREQLKEVTTKNMLELYERWKRGECKSFRDFPVWLCATVLKPECFTSGADPNKVRIVNLVCNEKMAWDVYLCKEYHRQLYKCKMVGIGHRWMEGGAYNLFKYMEGDIKGKWTYVTLDISRLDKNMREQLIAFLAYDLAQYVDGDFNKYIARCLAATTASRHLLWHGQQFSKKPHKIKYVQGTLSSGEYQTSSLDTRCAILINMSFDEWVRRKIEDGVDFTFSYFNANFVAKFSEAKVGEWEKQFEAKKKFIMGKWFVERPYAPLVDYGDDLFRGWASQFDFLTMYDHGGKKWPLLFMWFMKSKYCLSAKEEEVFVYPWIDDYSPLLTQLDHGVPVRYGPKYLQRRMIAISLPKLGQRIYPWRVTDDYYAKATVRLNHSFEPDVYLSVLRGLKFDTMGTNGKAFKFLDDIESELMRQHPECQKVLVSRLADEQYVSRNNMLNRLKKMGTDDITILSQRLTQGQVLSFFHYADPVRTYDNYIIGDYDGM